MRDAKRSTVLRGTPLVQETKRSIQKKEKCVMGTINSHLAQSNHDQLMSAGTKQHLANVISLSVAGESMTPAQIAQLFDDRVASTQTVQTAAAAHTAAVKANRDKRAQTASKVKAYTSIVRGMFGESPDTLAAFGLTPRKVAQKSAATKTIAAQKAKATRKARHTMGKDQKAGIVGTVPPANIAIIQGSTSSASGTTTTPPPTPVTPAPVTPAPVTPASVTPAPAANGTHATA